MKHTILSILALVVIAMGAPLVAQQGDTPQPYEERTNPNARSQGPGSGLTITGTVVSWDDKQLVLKTTTGMQHIQLLPDTIKPVDFTEGGMVSVDYTRTSQGIMIAQQIRPEGTVAHEGHGGVVSETTSATTTTTRPNLDTNVHTPDLDVNADLDVDVDVDGADLDVDADLDTNTNTYTTRAQLPSTASELPLVGLLGLLTLFGAVGVRSLFR